MRCSLRYATRSAGSSRCGHADSAPTGQRRRRVSEASTTRVRTRRRRLSFRVIAPALVAIVGIELAGLGAITIGHAHKEQRAARAERKSAVQERAKFVKLTADLQSHLSLDLDTFRRTPPARKFALSLPTVLKCATQNCGTVSERPLSILVTFTCTSSRCSASSPQWAQSVPFVYHSSNRSWIASGLIGDDTAKFRCSPDNSRTTPPPVPTYFDVNLTVARVAYKSRWQAIGLVGTYGIRAPTSKTCADDLSITWQASGTASAS